MSETATESEISALNSQLTFMYTLRNDSSLKDDEAVYFQLAMLYSSPDMRRLVRVHNLQLVASLSPQQVFRNADLDCVATVLCKIAVDKVLLFYSF
jgi:protein transport protein SEC24